MPWEHATTVRWVSELGAPLQPECYTFKGAKVEISEDHIHRAEVEIAKGATEVIFNATYCELACGERRLEVDGLAGAF